MIYFLILVLLFVASYINQTSFINYLLVLYLLSGLLSFIYSIYVSIATKIDINISKDICKEKSEHTIFINISNVLFHPQINITFSLYHKQLKTKIANYTIKCFSDENTYYIPIEKCGDYIIKVKKIRVKGLFNFIYIPKIKNKQLKQEIELKVYPKASKYSQEDIKKLKLNGDGEPINKRGNDFQELYEIRPLEYGDDLRYIHASLSAKFNQYMIKVGSETERNFIIFEAPFKEDFMAEIIELRKLIAIYDDCIKDSSIYFCVKYNFNWFVILNTRSLLGFIDHVYERYINE